MQSSPETTHSDALSVAQAQIAQLQAVIESLTHQLNWFRQQLFGTKSEKRHLAPDAQQLSLGEAFKSTPEPEVPSSEVKAHQRKRAARPGDEAAQPFFDESRVPIETIALPCPLTAGLSQAEIDQQFEPIGVKLTYRLAQRPGSFVVLKYERPQYKERESGVIACAPAPLGVLEGSRADVSLVAGLLIDKFAYHLPFYRQHQRMADCGITVTRPWLTQTGQKAIRLLEPIYDAQLASVVSSRVKAMDETPIKAGKSGHGKMKTGYFWPVYGEADEVCFPFFPTRSHAHVQSVLGLRQTPGSVLISDGYSAYQRYAQKTGLTHAQCWAHARRGFFEAEASDPTGVAEALAQIQALYAIEEEIRARNLSGADKQSHRLTHSKPRVDVFFEWVDQQFTRHGLTPTHPFVKALSYVRERRVGLEVFLRAPLKIPFQTRVKRSI